MKLTGDCLKIVVCFVAVCCCRLSYSQGTDTAFHKEWAAIDSLIVKADLTKTALVKINELQLKAKQKHLNDQVLKALLYRLALENRITTDDPAHSIKLVQAELDGSSDIIQKAVLHAIIANEYLRYFQDHRWNLYGRTATSGFVKTDITTWGVADFTAAISSNFLQALKPAAQLKQKKNAEYAAILISGNHPELRPTLFDLLAHEALDYFKSATSLNAESVVMPVLTDTGIFQPADVFIAHKFDRADSTDPRWLALTIYQQLLSFRRNEGNRAAMLDLDLDRLDWAHNNAAFPDKDILYQHALHRIIRGYPTEPGTAMAYYQLAQLEVDKAAKYKPFTDTAYRYNYLNALAIIREALSKFPVSISGAAELKNLETTIRTKELRTELEKVNIPHKPILASVSYRNADTLFTRVLRVLPGDSLLTKYINYNKTWEDIAKRRPLYSSMQLLPGSADHQTHTAEFKIDGLAPGYYALFCSTGKDFIDSTDKLSLQYFYVSALSYVQTGKDLFVLNRETGQPLEGAEVLYLKQTRGLTGQYSPVLISTQKTDRNGHARYNTADGNWQYTVRIPGDTLHVDDGDYVYNNPGREKEPDDVFERRNTRIFFFLDRSIYRPGQIVYYKGIAVTRDQLTGLSKTVRSKQSGWIYLKDVNSKPIDSARFELNEYGSFSGKFQLPQNTLTGNFTLETKGPDNSGYYFSVEEYKRPNFSVLLQKPKGSYRLNDTIVVTGNAKAYSGNPVDHAKLVYEVTRNTRYTDPWFYRSIRPVREGKAIAHGELVTDEQGNFQIRFKAIADDILDSTGNPLFDFTIKTDITDIAGETRSASTRVTTGFQALVLTVAADAVTEKDSAQKIKIVTTNLSDEKEAATVRVTIEQLQTPSRQIRGRELSKPDQFILSEEEFHKYFPEDEYAYESDFTTWKPMRQVLQRSINTGRTNELKLQPGTLAAGSYRITAETIDKYGRTVKQTTYTNVFDRKNGLLPYPAAMMVTSTSETAAPGQTVSFLTSSAVSKAFVIRETQTADSEQGHISFEQRVAGVDTINYTVSEANRGGVQ
ncbi:MAG: hypothetical protein JO301_02850, partial [Chitinophagaceae bacterium]|nr:hypothetical protein [Chitinophagaceae bacterium]